MLNICDEVNWLCQEYRSSVIFLKCTFPHRCSRNAVRWLWFQPNDFLSQCSEGYSQSIVASLATILENHHYWRRVLVTNLRSETQANVLAQCFSFHHCQDDSWALGQNIVGEVSSFKTWSTKRVWFTSQTQPTSVWIAFSVTHGEGTGDPQ